MSLAVERTASREALERGCYGMTVAELSASVDRGAQWFGGSKAFLATSMLSDVQELISFGDAASLERARQKVNCVKYVLGAYIESDRKEGAHGQT